LPTSLFLLINSYLTNRNFQIRCRSSTSDIIPINAGVPQGAILSPILFNIYASDQPTTPNTTIADYADYKVICSVHNNPIIASTNLQFNLNLQSEWYEKWRVKVNHSKSAHKLHKTVTFTLRHGHCPNVTINNIPIPSSDAAKYLGLILDQKLT